ncbi:Lacal_2735 family protein [Schleiferiaceae bacterium]|nr:Lacal_2735 family protein [Schleiferiaceae bacterium]
MSTFLVNLLNKILCSDYLEKKTEKEKMEARYYELIKKSYDLSHSNRADSDKVAAEAADLLKQIDSL